MADTYAVRIDDLPEEMIEAANNAECQAKPLRACIMKDFPIGDDVSVTILTPQGVVLTSTVADHRGHRIGGWEQASDLAEDGISSRSRRHLVVRQDRSDRYAREDSGNANQKKRSDLPRVRV